MLLLRVGDVIPAVPAERDDRQPLGAHELALEADDAGDVMAGV